MFWGLDAGQRRCVKTHESPYRANFKERRFEILCITLAFLKIASVFEQLLFSLSKIFYEFSNRSSPFRLMDLHRTRFGFQTNPLTEV